MAVEQPVESQLEATVERARARAAATEELRPIEERLDAVPVSPKLAELVRRVRSDGTFARAVDEIGREAPDLATT
jgi:hypothetical protein